jgi:hypothetical protein
MQTSQRQIPVRGGPQTNHWRDLLPVYQKELATFDKRLTALRSGSQISEAKVTKLAEVNFSLEGGGGQVFTVAKGESLLADREAAIASVVPELEGMKGIRVAGDQSAPIRFRLEKPAQILVGFFKSSSRKQVNVSPDTEQWNILLPNAVSEEKGLPISVWAKPLPAGENDLDLGKGAYVVLGFIPEDTKVTPHVNFDPESKQPPNLDWLFED